MVTKGPRINPGDFKKGNPGGPGNPFTKRANQLRARLYAMITDDNIDEVVLKLVDMAINGDIHAIREILNRTIGKPRDADVETAEPATHAPKVVLLDWRRQPNALPESN